jgi:signal transduction histidine kinase
VQPWPQSMCVDIISDKHWLTENVICLLSNAIKYSNGGTVKILVEHLQSDQCEDREDENGFAEVATDQPKAEGKN